MSPSKPLGTLVASPGVPGIEVAVFDGRLRRLPRDEAADVFRWSVPRGIYTVRYQAGSAIDEHLVTVDQVDAPVHAPIARLNFTSSAPLERTSSTHEYHTGPAVDASRRAPADVGLGTGAALFAMVRSRGNAFRRPSPAKGLTLERYGKTVFDFTTLDRDSGNTCAAMHVALNPGAYTLAYETSGCATNQSIYVTAGWQTQLFISETAEGAPVALDLPGVAVLMARPGEGFDPGGVGLHASELARKALRRGQSAMSPAQIRQLLEDKHENPMLGIFGAHLMLLRSATRLDVVANVLTHLDRLAPGHPDAACLHFALNPKAPVQLTAPPMLTRSWELLVNASTAGAVLPESAALEEVAGSLWDTGGAWLTWGAMKDSAEAVERSALRRITESVVNLGYRYMMEADRSQQNTARAILKLVADDAASDEVDLPGGRKRLLLLSQPLGSALAEEFSFKESEAAFINVATLAYAHKGQDGVKAALLAPQVRMPVSIVRSTARRLADRLDPPRPRGSSTPQRQQDGGMSRGASS